MICARIPLRRKITPIFNSPFRGKIFFHKGEMTMNKKLRLFNVLFIVVLLISACNMPKGNDEKSVAGTSAAQTVEAMLSATPILSVVTPSSTQAALPPTLTPIPLPVNTNTPIATATSNCNIAQFITDVTVPDGTVMLPGQAFTKKWRIKNIGACVWNGFSLVFDSGDSMGGSATTAIPVVNPNQEIDLTVNLTAPSTAGNYRGYWRITTNGSVLVPVVGGYQNRSFYVDIKVQNATPTPTNTSVPPIFAVTGVTYTVSTWSDATYTNCPRIAAKITVNGAGSVDYYWTRSDGASGTNGTLVFTGAGSQTVTADWALGSAAAGAPDEWMGIYIDNPNNQDFSHAVMPPCTAP
jgi:hypothetical protein